MDTLPPPWAPSGSAQLSSQSKSASLYPEETSSLSEPLPLVLLLRGTWLHPLYTVPSTLYKLIQSSPRLNLLCSMPKQSQLSLFLHISPMLQPFNHLSDSSLDFLMSYTSRCFSAKLISIQSFLSLYLSMVLFFPRHRALHLCLLSCMRFLFFFILLKTNYSGITLWRNTTKRSKLSESLNFLKFKVLGPFEMA